ncbi:putative protein [Arabidopsis thaliana]|nr:putative protein [Arabidopsis thaliana]CAB79489.1 putative protein [Arabidopsis thaliana]
MDRISQLSDDLLLQILSFIPGKDVVATSLLSKRWQSLWMLVSELEYDDSYHTGDYKSFSQFVYRSLLSNNAPVIKHLHLNLGPDCPAIDIGLWIGFALTRRLRQLKINIRTSSNDASFSLPSSLYTSDTLETLRLINFVLLDVPSSVCLPSLKVLHLKTVDYEDDASLPSLLFGCPNLEELFVERHDQDLEMDVTFVVPSLRRLSMIDKNYGQCDRYVIDVPSLKYLNITDDAVYDVRQIENMPELVEAHVDITQGVTHKFLRALTSVRQLSLCLSLSEKQHESGLCGIETPIGWKLPSSVPECLLFSLEAFEWIGYKGRRGDREVATYVLKNAACLRTAKFSPESTDVGEKYHMLKELASVPTASTSSKLLFD